MKTMIKTRTKTLTAIALVTVSVGAVALGFYYYGNRVLRSSNIAQQQPVKESANQPPQGIEIKETPDSGVDVIKDDSTTSDSSGKEQSSNSSDLVVTYFKAPGGMDRPTVADVKVANIGTGPAGPFRVKIYIGKGKTPEDAQLMINGTKTVSGLAAGEEITLNFTKLMYSGLAIHTWYHLIAVVDADNEVIETDEENNIKYRDIHLY